jgi:retron-type reverse transcriptase
LDRLIRLDNLRRAWRWVQSNPSPTYKNYFRSLYANYATAEGELLAGLHDRLKRGVYRPAHACKVYLPKASGGLRPYTLLTVEDQVVYQAFVNVIAEQFYPAIRDQYLSEVFSHLYAGPTSVFFYRRWERGFGAFNRAQREAFRNGLRYTARFDLTACYDSLDHNVLKHFLEDLGCDQDFCCRLAALLSHWTATGLNKRRIYQGHGIPQGPLSSDLVAEAVLHHFDKHRRRKGVRYLRYVDDIRLYANTEKEVRAAVYDLDLLSKEIGLFPQTSKIEIHEVEDIEAELKSVSRPDDDDFDWAKVAEDQDRLHDLLAELSPHSRVVDATRFKFVLSKAAPRAATNGRLWRVLGNHPDLYGNILSYFRRYRRLPKKDAARLIEELGAEEIHAVKIADLIRTADGRIASDRIVEIDTVVKKHWRQRAKLPADLGAVLGCWALKRGLIGGHEAKKAVADLPEWYARAELVTALDSRAIPQPELNQVLFGRLNDPVSDVAVAAAVHLGLQGTLVDAAVSMHIAAGPVLSAFGVLDGEVSRACGIAHAFERLLGEKPHAVDWKRFFGKSYRHAEIKAVRWSGYLTDATAWVNLMDVFCDLLLDALYRNEPSLGNYTLGRIGSVLSAGGRLQRAYPRVFKLAHEIHEKRGESDLSHPKKRSGNTYIKPTSFIKYSYFKTARNLVRAALAELGLKWGLPIPKMRSPKQMVSVP